MLNLLDKYGLLHEWKDTSVYRNREGEIIPEIKDMMWAIKSYYHQRAKGGSGNISNSPYDYDRGE